jgi:hypothetical protein
MYLGEGLGRGDDRIVRWLDYFAHSDVASINGVGEGDTTQEQKWKEGENAHDGRGA